MIALPDAKRPESGPPTGSATRVGIALSAGPAAAGADAVDAAGGAAGTVFAGGVASTGAELATTGAGGVAGKAPATTEGDAATAGAEID